jgi:hypothetical protein
MLEKIVDFVCGYEEIAFESEFDLDTSVRRLAAEVNPPLGGLRPLVTGSGVSWVRSQSNASRFGAKTLF